MDLILYDNADIGPEFFEVFEKLNKISELEVCLKSIEMEKSPLYLSLEKDVNEIKSIGLTKLIKYINKNVERLSVEFIVQSIKLLKTDSEIFQNFKLKILNLRPDIPLELVEDTVEETKAIDEISYDKKEFNNETVTNNN